MLQDYDWCDVLASSDCQDAYTVFNSVIISKFNDACPYKEFNVVRGNDKPWMTRGLKLSIRHKNKLFRLYKKKKSADNGKQYKLYKSKLQHVLRTAKKTYFTRLFEESKSCLKKSWSVINKVIGRKNSVQCNKQFVIDNEVVTDKQEIVNAFYDYYVSIGPDMAENIPVVLNKPQDYLTSSYVNSFYLKPVGKEELFGVVKQMRNVCAGLDGINAFVVKEILDVITQPLLHVINMSFEQGVLPSQLKTACITPLYKGGDALLLKNYRPVSVLPVLSKVFEKLMCNRLTEFISSKDILHKNQFGFRKNHSTELALTVLTEKLMHALDNGEHTIGLFLDLSKAFDTVNHDILLYKLSHYGIRGVALDWFKSYLNNRNQAVKFDVISDVKAVVCGVPQGSILGPVLFLLNVNDLFCVSSVLYTIMFADDTNMFIQGKNISELENIMNEEIKKKVTWLYANMLSLNIDKTYCMLFTDSKRHSNRVVNIYINGSHIETAFETKFLGVILDNKLSRKSHIDYISLKIAKGIGIVKKAKFCFTKKTLLSLYCTFIFLT